MILALAVGFVYFGFGSSLFLGFVFVFCFFFCFFVHCVMVDKGERWLWPVVVDVHEIYTIKLLTYLHI